MYLPLGIPLIDSVHYSFATFVAFITVGLLFIPETPLVSQLSPIASLSQTSYRVGFSGQEMMLE